MTTYQDIKQLLKGNRFNVSSWAIHRGFNKFTVHKVLDRLYEDKCYPSGEVGKRIISQLSNDLGINIP